MKASDVMTREIISVGPDTTLSAVVKSLVEHRISAVPVVEHGAVVGIVSENDLLRRAEIGTQRGQSRWLEVASSSASLVADCLKSHGCYARDVMTAPPITVGADTPVAEIADILESRQIKRVPVVVDGKLIGIVSRANLIQALASSGNLATDIDATNDRRIREAVLDELRRHRCGASLTETNIIVNNGEVHLWGHVRSEEERIELLVAAKKIAGVSRVADHLQNPDAVFF